MPREEKPRTAENGEATHEGSDRAKKIHPIIIYPYNHPSNTRHLEALYDGLIKNLNEPDYSRPITVLSGDTRYRCDTWSELTTEDQKRRQTSFRDFERKFIQEYSRPVHAWI